MNILYFFVIRKCLADNEHVLEKIQELLLKTSLTFQVSNEIKGKNKI